MPTIIFTGTYMKPAKVVGNDIKPVAFPYPTWKPTGRFGFFAREVPLPPCHVQNYVQDCVEAVQKHGGRMKLSLLGVEVPKPRGTRTRVMPLLRRSNQFVFDGSYGSETIVVRRRSERLYQNILSVLF